MARPNRRLQRYTPYVDGPDPLAPPVDLAEALDAIGEDVMAGYSPERAMREFLRRGGRDQAGLDELARRVAERRKELTQRNNLDGTLQQVKELLDRAVLAERKQLARDVDMDEGDRALAQLQLDNLPSSPAAAVNELNGYDWRSNEARAEFDKIKDLLGREVLDQRFAGIKEALENATDDDRAALNEMLADLNGLLDARKRGQDTQEQFDDFMAKHGDYFPEQPRTLDELLDALAARAAAAQRMRNSMTQEQRDELDALAQQAFGSSDLMNELSQLDDNLQSPATRRGLGELRADGRRERARARRRHRRVPGSRRPRRARGTARAVLRGLPAGRPRPREAVPPARTRRGRRRPHPAAAGEGSARRTARSGAARTASSR